MRTKQKRLAGLICAVLVLAALLSALFLVEAADHVCTGADCPVCACMQQTARRLKTIASGTAGAARAALYVPRLAVLLPGLAVPAVILTPVQQKVRLND